MEQERMEAENRRIMEFVSRQAQVEESRVAKMREREAAKEHLHKIVETTFSSRAHAFLRLFNDTHLQQESLLSVLLQLFEQIEEERQQREELERVRQELYLEEEEEANRQREIVSMLSRSDSDKDDEIFELDLNPVLKNAPWYLDYLLRCFKMFM